MQYLIRKFSASKAAVVTFWQNTGSNLLRGRLVMGTPARGRSYGSDWLAARLLQGKLPFPGPVDPTPSTEDNGGEGHTQ